jgi:hypothetical protein
MLNKATKLLKNTEEVSGIGQNKANSAIADGRWRMADLQIGVVGPSPSAQDQSTIVHRQSSIMAARPKVKELLEQMQSDPEARALVETFLLSQMVGEEWQREEQELAAWQRERQKRETLEQGLEQMVAAQQELESKNRRLRAQMGASELLHAQAREQREAGGGGGTHPPRARPPGDLQQDQGGGGVGRAGGVLVGFRGRRRPASRSPWGRGLREVSGGSRSGLGRGTTARERTGAERTGQ